jgi:hypothetical protein
VRALCEDEPVHGELAVSSRGRREIVRVGLEALRRGLLVGRYERCHSRTVTDERVSRVHLLLVELAGQVCAIDLASSNGTFSVDEGGVATPLRAAVVQPGQALALAGGDTLVSWIPS